MFVLSNCWLFDAICIALTEKSASGHIYSDLLKKEVSVNDKTLPNAYMELTPTVHNKSQCVTFLKLFFSGPAQKNFMRAQR